MRAAIFQSDTTGLTPDERLARLRVAAERSTADILLCPELFMSGYAVDDEVHRYAEPADGAFALGIAEVARQTNTIIAYGYPEIHDGIVYNAAQCIGPNGVPLANHRKLLLPPGFEADYFASGKGIAKFALNGTNYGVLICYDAEFPETVREAALSGIQVLLIPTALGAQWSVVANRVIPARAFENGIFVLYANHAGSEGEMSYLGSSCIVAPDGTDLARAGEDEAVIIAELDLSAVAVAQARLPYLRDVETLRRRISSQPPTE